MPSSSAISCRLVSRKPPRLKSWIALRRSSSSSDTLTALGKVPRFVGGTSKFYASVQAPDGPQPDHGLAPWRWLRPALRSWLVFYFWVSRLPAGRWTGGVAVFTQLDEGLTGRKLVRASLIA